MQLQDEKWVAHAPGVLGRAPSRGSGQRRPATHRPVHRHETGIFGGGAENNTRGACATQSPTASFRLRMRGFGMGRRAAGKRITRALAKQSELRPGAYFRPSLFDNFLQSYFRAATALALICCFHEGV